ncbi:MAG TPA: thiamine phosphate synthase [Phycisphaerae bacterium]|nr:thiamine phosphate synthase [Phycisphaerae bacterium]HRW54667.1 thiamine phosphate synthase [Phycisphaerae bacterium]
MNEPILRILDANFNRAREGLRVLEEYARFVLNDSRASGAIKRARHALSQVSEGLDRNERLASRDTPGDVGTRITTTSETTREGAESVAQAATARVSEALRCIEEYGKLVSSELAAQVERLRYDLYSIEQDVFVTSARRRGFSEARIHVLLTASLCRRSWRETAEAILDAGADVIQLREKGLSDSALLERAQALRELTRRCGAMLVINDRADIARLADADAVHLGQEDLPVADARRILGPTILVGGSAHDEREIERMLDAGVDYLGVGPMFASGTKPEVEVRGPEVLQLARRLVSNRAVAAEGDESPPCPLVAIGGITEQNVARLFDMSGAGFAVAVCGAVIDQDDPGGAVRRLKSAIRTHVGSSGATP